MAFLTNIKNEKTLKLIFFATTPWPLPPLSSFPTATATTADEATALPPCHCHVLALPCCHRLHCTALAANPALSPSCRHRRHRQAACRAAALPPSCRRHRGCEGNGKGGAALTFQKV
jgi:hypothetical protein